ncbi:CHAD domain-containing protein [Azospirillum sp.]|uniref:CYTH and CHAD domain-containing protein n=1 Tax=Azospirillum sp. TaxID=34012 RepID=UPI003D729513
MAHEVELKLHVQPDDLARLAALPLLAERAEGAPVTGRLRTVYFDTPDLRLYGRGIALRLRHDGTRRIQGLKTVAADPQADAAAVAVRREWEWPVEGDAPDFARLDAEGAGALVPEDARGELMPVFATDFTRTAVLLRLDAQTSVEVAIDDGGIAAGRGDERISEVELELKSGRIGRLFALAQELHGAVPLRIGMESKAELGYRMVSGRAPAPVLGDPPMLSPLSTVAEAFRHVVRHGLRQILANEPCVLAGGDAEGLHRIRIALRHLRTALTLFAPVVAPAEAARLEHEIRWLAKRLRPARAWDVLASALPDPALAPALAEARRPAAERAVAALREPRCTALLLALGVWLEEGHWHAGIARARLDAPMADLAGPWLAARHAKARKAEDPERLRRRLRTLRYGVEVFRGLYPPDSVRPYGTALDSLYGTLDALHDLRVAEKRLKALAGGKAAKPLERRAAQHRKALAERLKAFREMAVFWG